MSNAHHYLLGLERLEYFLNTTFRHLSICNLHHDRNNTLIFLHVPCSLQTLTISILFATFLNNWIDINQNHWQRMSSSSEPAFALNFPLDLLLVVVNGICHASLDDRDIQTFSF